MQKQTFTTLFAFCLAFVLFRPAFGKLAELDPALVVTPPPGLEAGDVPIVTRQAAKN